MKRIRHYNVTVIVIVGYHCIVETHQFAFHWRLKAGYPPSHWVQQGGGDKWDQGYDVTARFLEYCSSLRVGFVAELNAKMRTGYSNFFSDLLGKTLDQL
ncbi:Plant basic secretory protein (BSP) family protein [Thalictrum thalictroides]|uniref:Plant basic secretory protein (BSP) family protein n=1 Tax=Thalictrum thalictroides TaxID=46969 RepID=A0A7J6V542_THATH|nr:Plant basic secretory protein (BSP) family protein [Thalictrum thalictroides]